MITTEDAFRQSVARAPDDLAPALIYADWLDDQARCREARFVRVAASSGLLPVLSPSGLLLWWHDEKDRWRSWRLERRGWLVEAWSPASRWGPKDE